MRCLIEHAEPNLNVRYCVSTSHEFGIVSFCPECEPLNEPMNGYTRCMSYSGKQGCTLGCKNGMAFPSSAVISYECGPATNWKWNGKDINSLPKCLRK